MNKAAREARLVAKEARREAKKSAEEAKRAAKKVVAEARREAEKAAEEAKRAAEKAAEAANAVQSASKSDDESFEIKDNIGESQQNGADVRRKRSLRWVSVILAWRLSIDLSDDN